MNTNFNPKLPLVLYGAGRNASNAYAQVLSLGIKPVCFTDKDSKKWGKPAYLGGNLTVLALDEVRKKYGDFNIYITVAQSGSFAKLAVEAYLVEEEGISSDKILNFEPYIKRISCGLFEDTIAPLGERDIGLCRGGRLINVTQMPTTEWVDDPAKSLDDFLAMRQKLINDNQENLVNSPCNNCIVLRNAAWPSEYHVRNYVLSTEPKSPCQFKCIYCYAGHYGNNDFETKKSSDKAIDKRVDLLLELEKRGLADPAFTVISLSDGEIAVDPKRANLYKLIERYKSWIYTNAGIYSEEIAVLLKKGLTHIVVSIDAGTPETFTKVKGIDAYIKVCENLKKYAAIAPRLVRLQYIYLPNRNDDIKDIDGFVELCDNINPEMVSVLLDVLSDKNTLDMKVLLGFFDLLDKLLLHGHSLFIGANVFLSNEERDIILDFAKNKADGLIRDEQYYHRLKLALNEKVY